MATTPVVATNERGEAGCNAAASTCRNPGERTITDAPPKSRGGKPRLVGPMLTDTIGGVAADDAAAEITKTVGDSAGRHAGPHLAGNPVAGRDLLQDLFVL